MANGIPFSIRFRDRKNQTSLMRAYQSGAGADDGVAAVQSLGALIQAMSNASVSTSYDRATVVTSGVSGEYDDVEDKAVIVFQTGAGELHRYQIAAPKNTIFQADQETIDFGNGAVSAFTAAMIGLVVSRGGSALTASVGGYRTRVKTQRKFNIFTRNPALTGQGL